MKLRVRFTKLGKVRFTSHRDVARIWERAVRRVGVPVAYSQGFSPRARLSFGLALPTGAESLAEYLDVDLTAPVDVEHLPEQLSAALPAGMEVTAAAVAEAGADSLQQSVYSCSWDFDVPADPPTIDAGVRRILAAETVVVTRQRKGRQVEDDLRPSLLDLEVAGPTPGGTLLRAELGCWPRTVRPAELLAALDLPGDRTRVRRTHQWMLLGDARREPLPAAPVASTARAGACAPRRDVPDVRSSGQRPPEPRSESRPQPEAAARR